LKKNFEHSFQKKDNFQTKIFQVATILSAIFAVMSRDVICFNFNTVLIL